MSAIYMAVTADKYELPVDFDNTARGLSRKLGFPPARVSELMSKGIKQTKLSDGQRVKFVKVPIEDDE